MTNRDARPPDHRALVVGARLDRYELVLPVAEGGMASVWLARLRGKRGFEQLVAIKTIKPHLGEDVRFEQMFLDEARIASRIRHPNVAQILDLGEERGMLYLVMEWVDGECLSRTRRLVERSGGKIPIPVALRIMADVAAGLHAAHELKDELGADLGVIHRDVSPQNILVSTTGTVKLIDFGIAKARNRATAETVDGLVKGKVAYMAPEQAAGSPVDRRADVWSAGVCLYELLTGSLPFDGDSQQEILKRLTTGTAPPRLPSSMPEVVRNIVERALARDVEQRFPTAAALERALEAALVSLGTPTTSDDLATFLDEMCPERRAARQNVLETVERITESLDGLAPAPEVTKDLTPLAKRSDRRPRAVTFAALALGALVGIGSLVLVARRDRPPVATAPASTAGVAPSETSTSLAFSASPVATLMAPVTAPVTAVTVKPPKPRAQPPRAKSTPPAATPAAEYDSDGIPIVKRSATR